MNPLTSQDPARIGPYRLISRLGEGGMGLVYLGRSEAGRTVAVKVVQAEYAGNQEFRPRFAREVAAARRVGGSWTAEVLDADPEAAVPWVATRYIPGPDLTTVVAKDFGPLPEHSVRVLANRLALALEAVHSAGLIHRDLKPSNVLVTVDGPRVIDFGIARAMDSLAGDSLHTRTGMLIGSPGFMSPEQVRGLELTPASDVFCLGAVLVHAATGRLLFGAADTGLPAHLFRIAEDEPDLTGVPASLLDLVRACLEKDPAKRPTPKEVAARTAQDSTAEWLPGVVLAQLGRHAAQLLDYAPDLPVDAPPARPDPLVKTARPQTAPPPPAYAPTAPSPFGTPQGFGPPTPPGTWSGFPAAAHPGDPAPPHPRRWWGLAVIVLAQLLVLLDVTSFNLAAPVLQADMGMRADALSPLFMAYTLSFGGLLLLGGHIADRTGRRRTFLIGLAGCAVASALGGAAGGEDLLILARLLQGAFAALLTASSLALVTTGFTDPEERHRAIGIYAATAGGGSALGLFAGGWLMESATWRLSLYAVAALAVTALIGAAALVHERPEPTDARLDSGGVLVGTGGLVALGYGLTQAGSDGWTVPLVLAALTGGALLLGAFLLWHAGRADSFAGASRTPGQDRLGCFLVIALAGSGTMGSFVAVNHFLLDVLGYAPARAGAALLPMAAAAVIGATQVSARLLIRAEPRVLIVGGLAVMTVGLVVLTRLEPGGGYATHVLPGLLLTGFGTGMSFMPLLATATAAAGPGLAGVRSGTVLAGRELGITLGSALLSSVLATELSHVASQSDTRASLLRAYTTSLWWAVGGMVLACLAAGLMITAKAPGARTPGR
ncbi:MDR family MFS transporter [Streptomyces sp. ITFR-16]|uniref:MDR family MFS transporter n=1 Tax=Streptomyces sp. ITFR-16 TaxID=3075198 RepID=UPI00288C407C|nr:MDR family MFS transporter [Streptomyces sp. ITFR-16]WNI22004.1 MDR family MFS transporter [Streptomyces sp. ITFR-16]